MTAKELKDILRRGVLVLDGAMGTMIQRLGLGEEEFRGERFAEWPGMLRGNNDLLCLTRPDDIAAIHRAYVEAGADIISTNSFNSNALSMADYGMEGLVPEMARRAAEIARGVVDSASRRILVAGSVGPTNHAASLSPDVSDPSARDVTFAELSEAFFVQIKALISGGVDLLLMETVYDTLNLKAALDGARRAMEDAGREIAVMVSATIADKSGRILSGQTIDALVNTVSGCPFVVSIGLNCSFGPVEMASHIRHLAEVSPLFTSCHPNAGLPDIYGNYKSTAPDFGRAMWPLLRDGILNIVGGCCGTDPEYIARLRSLADNAVVHSPVEEDKGMRLAGLEGFSSVGQGFITVGERCNVAGSRKFLRLIKEGNFEEALRIAKKQIEDGAQIIDINFDDALLDAPAEMVRFLNFAGAEPDVARVPFMLDSSGWDVIEAGLMSVQGKPIVNSISLKQGEDEFVRRAVRISQLGAAVVVMAFDEKGQADTYERRIEICARAYRILTEKVGFNPEDIVFDPNVMAIATGIPEHNYYARDFIRATKWIKENLPEAKVSGGVSNLSFSFRGNNPLREAMHSVFLHHARLDGMDMAIINPAAMPDYYGIESGLRVLLDDVILARRPEAAEELSQYAMSHLPDKGEEKKTAAIDRSAVPVDTRLEEAIIHGDSEFLQTDLEEKLASGASPEEIVNNTLMSAMEEVGRRFGEGRMFLPQVVKTARVMKEAVAFLRPLMNAGHDTSAKSAGKIVIATVKGDVHDIGKNIVSIVLECNNFEVVDLGVMVEAERIVNAAAETGADIVCLSGLITPSLAEMAHVARLMEERGLNIPLIVGGAATSPRHTALKIAPLVSFPVVHARDASQNPLIAARLISPDTKEEYISEINSSNRSMSESDDMTESGLPLAEAREHRLKIDWTHWTPVVPKIPLGEYREVSFTVGQLMPLLNWHMFFHAWRLSGKFILDFPYNASSSEVEAWLDRSGSDRDKASQAYDLYQRCVAALSKIEGYVAAKGIVRFVEANSQGDDIILDGQRMPMLRNEIPDKNGTCLCLSDFIMPVSEVRKDITGVFAVTASLPENTGLDTLLVQTLSDRLAEAASEMLHFEVRKNLWGYASGETFDARCLLGGDYVGIRPAVGYPSVPDQMLNKTVAILSGMSKIGIKITENGAMDPSSSVAGIYISHPQAGYFLISPVSEEQIADYAGRCGTSREQLKGRLGKYARS